MTTYRYLFGDLLQGGVLAELPLSGVRFDLQLNGAGSFGGTLPIGDAKVQALPFLAATLPGRTAYYVERDGVLITGGIILTRRIATGGNLELAGAEFESYFAQRLITKDAVFAQVDQLSIAQSLINTAQAVSGGNIGITVGTETSGVLRDRTYNGYELKPVLEALTQLSQVQGGFDFSIDVAYDTNGAITKTLHLGYPRRGARAAASGFVFEFPGNLQSYSWPEDATLQATTTYATGSGAGPGTMIATSVNANMLSGGYPLLEGKWSYPDVLIASTLQAHADSDLTAHSSPVTIPTVTVRGDLDPVVGSYITGDEVRLRITDDRFPATSSGGVGLDLYKRIIGIAVTPPGTGPETVTLTLGDIVA